MPHEYDSEEEVALEVLTHPETTPETDARSTESKGPGCTELRSRRPSADPEPPESLEETYDPAEHNVTAVLEYIDEHPEQRDEVLAMERADRGRKGILGDGVMGAHSAWTTGLRGDQQARLRRVRLCAGRWQPEGEPACWAAAAPACVAASLRPQRDRRDAR